MMITLWRFANRGGRASKVFLPSFPSGCGGWGGTVGMRGGLVPGRAVDFFFLRAARSVSESGLLGAKT